MSMRRPDDSRVSLASAAVLAGVAAHAAPALAAPCPAVRKLLGVRDRVADGKSVALTFDDGPHPEGTPAVLEVLAAAGVSATFFLVGEQVAQRPALAAEIVAAGHEVGLHCNRHRNLLRLTPSQIHDDLTRAEDVITASTGRPVDLYRPPYGIFSAAALMSARRRGWTPLLWTRWGRDWEATATPDSIRARLTTRLTAQDVLLLHDADYYSASGSWQRTVAALPAVLEDIAGHGLEAIAASRASVLVA
jgi:peptidoglycan/xylan/chitin deacetylase (PgdA/CDA1 family)